ncbi:hypothetical protein [Limosilactobacillus reuteri]|uniref:hypothetical protein n=1 Tax=Limosilactobacillus reuteri TaxID=1598 RepID=UPI002B059A28|nr:hypothetical protein [Limosilactobacillus reuteri]
MIETKLHTELVSLLETRIGEVILALKRGEEVKQLLIGETGLAGVVYESSYDYYIFDKKWTEEQFDDYWENGGEEKEIDNYIDGTVEYYDDWSTWEEINW